MKATMSKSKTHRKSLAPKISQGSDRILLSIDKRSSEFQRSLIYSLSCKLQELVDEFNRLSLGIDFPLSIVASIQTANPRSAIMSIVLPAIGNGEINGNKISSRKLFDLMEINITNVEQAWRECSDLINQRCRTAGSELKVSIESNFFTLKDRDEVKVNESELEKWTEANCYLYAETESQIATYNIVSKISESLNELRKDSQAKAGKSKLMEVMHFNPSFMTKDWIGRLVKYDEGSGKYIVNHEFILTQ